MCHSTEGIFQLFSSVASSLLFLSVSSSLTCHLVVFQEDMTSEFASNLFALTNTNSYCLSSPSSLLFLLRLVSFFFCLSVLLVEGSGNHMLEQKERDRKRQNVTPQTSKLPLQRSLRGFCACMGWIRLHTCSQKQKLNHNYPGLDAFLDWIVPNVHPNPKECISNSVQGAKVYKDTKPIMMQYYEVSI